MVIMKKEVLLLFPTRFTKFHYYKYEISRLESEYNIKVIIHDLSNLLASSKFNKEWKTELEEKTSKFKSLISWIFYFNKIRKKKIIIFNYVPVVNLNSFIINFLVRLSKLPVIIHEPIGPFSTEIINVKKNTRFFLTRIKQHGFNFRIYFFALKSIFFRFLINLIKYNTVILLSNNFEKKNFENIKRKNFFKIDFNTHDYSNALLAKQNKKEELIKNYIIYLDNGAPYFSGDAHFKGDSLYKFNLKKDYNDLNLFFDKIEEYFDAKIIVIPHPKYKSPDPKRIKSLNPYFNNRIVNNDYDSLAKLSSECLFFINKMSTALSYAIFHKKPVIQIFSSEYFHAHEERQSIFGQAKNLGKEPIDICKFNKEEIEASLVLDESKYEKYKYEYLTPKNKTVEKIPNYKIIGNFIEGNFNKIFS